jgi:hypothetical protein
LRGKIICKDKTWMKSPNKDHFIIEKIATPMFDVVWPILSSTITSF